MEGCFKTAADKEADNRAALIDYLAECPHQYYFGQDPCCIDGVCGKPSECSMLVPLVVYIMQGSMWLGIMLWVNSRYDYRAHGGRTGETDQALSLALPAALAALPKVHVSADHAQKQTECPICLKPFSLGQPVVQLPCARIFP